MATLAIDNDEIKASIAAVAGMDRTAVWDATFTADVDRVIRSGRRRFFNEHNWHFLEEEYVLSVTAPYETGTITVASGTVTGSGTTFTNAMQNQLLAVSGGLYRINTFTDTTTLVIDDTDLSVTSAAEYKIYFVQYDFPSTFGGWVDPLTIDNATFLTEAGVLPEYVIRSAQSVSNLRTGQPVIFTISQRMDTQENVDVTYFLELFPLPDVAYVARGKIRHQPGDGLSETGDVFPSIFSEALLGAILAAADRVFNDNGDDGALASHYINTLLPKAKLKDAQMRNVLRVPFPSTTRRSTDPTYIPVTSVTIEM